MSHSDIILPHEMLARPLTEAELAEVGGGEYYEAEVVQPNTSSMTTGCGAQSKHDSDYD